jgi:hypothetical protein
MAKEYQVNLPAVPVELISQTREISHPSTLPGLGEPVSRLTDLLVAACEDTGLQEKDAARSQGYDPKYWPRIKSGEKAAHLDRITGLPRDTQRDFVARWGRQLGMDIRPINEQRRRLYALKRALVDVLELEDVG